MPICFPGHLITVHNGAPSYLLRLEVAVVGELVVGQWFCGVDKRSSSLC